MVTRRSAKPLCRGSTPLRASQKKAFFLSIMGIKTKLALASLGTSAVVATAAATTNILPLSNETINTTTVKKENIQQTLTLAGEVDAKEKATLRFQTSGRLSWVGVETGDYVKKYQIVATLDRRELQKKLEKDLNSFLSERWDLDQTREDYEGVAITDEFQRIIDKAQFDLNKAIIDVELQDLALQYSRLMTPIEGIVTKIDTPYAGVNITPAGAEFEVINPQTLNFVAVADQTEVVLINEDSAAELVLDSYPDRTLNGYVDKIDLKPKSGETGTVYAVTFKIDNLPSEKLRLGMTGDLTFTTMLKRQVLTLPFSYVNEEDGKYYVFKEQKGKVIKKKIKVGIETDDRYEIVSGLEEGDKIYDQAPKGIQNLQLR